MKAKKQRSQKKDFQKKIKKIKFKASVDNDSRRVFEKIGKPTQKPFEADPFQTEAIKTVTDGYDCLVTAPTGSGKTWIAKELIRRAVKENKKTWYCTPLKALTNSIYTNFKNEFGANKVGILTGDRKENTNSNIVIGTTEILRNQLYDSMYSGQFLKTDFVVIDEAHYLGDQDRGVVWEEVMIYLPSRIPLLLLSATIGNADEIANWLSHIRNRECKIIKENRRSVPLHHMFLASTGRLFPLVDQRAKRSLNKKIRREIFEKRVNFSEPIPIENIMEVLDSYNLLPAIFFLKSRADCDKAISLCSPQIANKDPEKKARLKKRLKELIEQVPYLEKHKQRYYIENFLVASHHSGQLPIWKIIVETLMTEGLIDAIFATSTVAAGVNFPARTVVLFNSDRFNGKDFVSLDATQFQQMTGRAGRRGMDNVGFSLLLPGKFMNLKLVVKLINASPTSIDSQLKIDFSMVLNLLLSNRPPQIKSLLENSFAEYLVSGKSYENKNNFNMKSLWENFLRHIRFLKEEAFVNPDDTLSFDGKWAAQLRLDNPLLVAQVLRLKLFPTDNPVLLASIMAAFVNEKHFKDEEVPSEIIPQDLLKSYLKVKEALVPISDKMLNNGFYAHSIYLLPCIAVYEWALGRDWEFVLNIMNVAEGDMTRLILRTAENLQHFINLEKYFPDIANCAAKSIELIKKEPVESYFDIF